MNIDGHTMTRRTAVRGSLAAALSLALLASACADDGGEGGGEAGKDLTINIGMFPVISPVPIMQEQKLLEEKGYEVNWVPVEAGLPGAASALAAGRLDMVYANSSSGTIIFSGEPDVAWFVGRSFINMNETVASKAANISDIKQLAGRKVVVSGMKTASTLFYELGLRKAGVNADRDKYFVAGTGPSMVDVLAAGGTEVAGTYVPYSSEMARRGIGKVLFTASDALGRTEPGDGFIVSRKFADENPEAVEDVLRAQFAANDTIKKDPSSVAESLSEFAGVPVETIKAAFEGEILAPSYAPDVDAMVEVATLAEENGFAPEGVKDLAGFAKEFANPSFAEKVLGES